MNNKMQNFLGFSFSCEKKYNLYYFLYENSLVALTQRIHEVKKLVVPHRMCYGFLFLLF